MGVSANRRPIQEKGLLCGGQRASMWLRGAAVRVQLLRKERSVGVVPQASTIYEVLEELAIAVQVPLFPAKSH